jgi:hypothetical protein
MILVGIGLVLVFGLALTMLSARSWMTDVGATRG